MRQLRVMWVTALAAALCVGLASCSAQTQPELSGDQATLEVASFPAADIWIDGTWKGSTPASITVEPGTHEVILRQTGFGEHKERIDVAAGSRQALEGVLIAQDVDEPQVLAHLARPFDVTVEPFEAPERHRGGRKAPPAMLLWPREDVRPEGLTSFAIEVSEEYEGDGFLVFRKGRNILYKEVFDPETMTTVATIPLEVLQAADVGDTVTWGIQFDSRRKKAVEARFKVVNRPKAERRLEKIASSSHMARQPALVRALVEAKALENYRLYTEALTRSLEILQEHPTSVAPYQAVVTTLRRMDGEDSRLWAVASQYVSGSGRARASRSGIAAFAPQGAQPLPVPTAPPVVATGPTGPGLRPGDSVIPGLRPVPSPTAPTAPDVAVTPSPRTTELARATEEATSAATTARAEASQAAEQAESARETVETASAESVAKHAAADEAERVYEESPTSDASEALAQAKKDAEQADEDLEDAMAQANRLAEEAAETHQKAGLAEQFANVLGEAGSAARAVEDLAAALEAREAIVADAEAAHADNPNKTTAKALDDARNNAADMGAQLEAAMARAAELAREVERIQAIEPELPGPGDAPDELIPEDVPGEPTEPPSRTLQAELTDRIETVGRDITQAERKLAQLETEGEESPDDEGLQIRIAEARDALEEFRAARDEIVKTYTDAFGALPSETPTKR